VVLYPPPQNVKPNACVDSALTAAFGHEVDNALVKTVWLGVLDARYPAYSSGGKQQPYFTGVLAWVIVADARADIGCVTCGTPSPGQAEVDYVDANTGQRLFVSGFDNAVGPIESPPA